MFCGLRADRLVSEQLLEALAPCGMEAAIEAIDSLRGANDERLQQKTLTLEHARYGWIPAKQLSSARNRRGFPYAASRRTAPEAKTAATARIEDLRLDYSLMGV